MIITSIILATIKKTNNIIESKYELEIRKLGYLTINKYESIIKEVIFGKDGYYASILQNLINKYKIEKVNAYEIRDYKDRTYLLCNNKDKDEIYIINNNLKDTPKINKLKYSNIRYYRNDTQNNRIILKTDLEELYYRVEAKAIFDKVIPEKDIENQKETNPSEYINDFERFMKEIKDKDLIKKETSLKLKKEVKNKLNTLIILEMIIIIVSYIYKDYLNIIFIIYLILLIFINKYLIDLLSIKNVYIKSDQEYIKTLNNNLDCQNKFKELKLALNIPEKVYKIYSDEGAEFLIWNNDGYFHLFLNLIYFNVIYLSVRIQDIDYYHQ